MKHGSLFTGVGGIDIGFDNAGIETVWQCEINKQARSVLAKHWPDATRYEDVTQVDGSAVTPVDIITFGSPCQDLSIAGRRAGFQDGTRSNLFFEAIRIIKEMRDASENQYPRYAVWENVRGALSSNGGADFLAAIQALADIGAVDISWRVVNTCHFGPPQRRVRVFVVADFGGERAGEILSQPTRVLWHPPTIGEAGPETAGETAEGSGVGGWHTVRDTSSCLQTGGIAGTRIDAEAAGGGQLLYKEIANCLSTSNQRIDYETETFIIESQPYVKVVRSGARDAEGNLPAEVWREEYVAPTLNVFDNGGESRATVLTVQYYDGYNQKLEGDGVYRTLRIGQDSGDFIAVPESASVVRMRGGKEGGGKGALVKDDMSLTLATANDQTLFQREPSGYRVRRLTPRECERLQGWPDDHTRWADDGKEISDSARYKMAGNGVSAPVAQWLGENIMKAQEEDKS